MTCRAVITGGLLCALGVLGGCGVATGGAVSGVPATSPGYVAMARGEVDVAGGLVPVYSEQAGRLLTVTRQLGARVRAGEVLATIDPRALREALTLDEASLAIAGARESAASAARESAASLLGRLREARAADAAPDLAVDQAQADLRTREAEHDVAVAEAHAATIKLQSARAALDEAEIRAPVAGELVEIHARPLQHVVPDATVPIFVLLPDAPRVVRVELGEEFAAVVHRGMAVDVVLSDPERVVAGRTVRVSSVLRRRSDRSAGDAVDGRVIPCEIEVPDSSLRVGQQVLVRFKRDT